MSVVAVRYIRRGVHLLRVSIRCSSSALSLCELGAAFRRVRKDSENMSSEATSFGPVYQGKEKCDT